MVKDLDEFKFKDRKLDSGVLKLITVARLAEKKGYEYSIKAVANLIRANSGIKIEYIIIGDGPSKGSLETLITKLGIERNVKLLGEFTRDQILKLYGEAYIFILPSVTANDNEQEGISVVLMAAQAVGLPTISTFHSGIPEVVMDGESGFLVPERDINAISAKLDYLIRHPDRWGSMGRYGRKLIEERYDIKMLNSKLVRIYDALLTDNMALLDELRGLQ
ncbi:glycosyltransferase [Desulfobacterota bacterium AH_259_B03_O07]|nr:glycosyltransferase [Desulfobacterota bacterium AH_259_B03_O07]